MNNSLTIVEHHNHYLEIDGYDEVIPMTLSEHTKYHNKMRGKINLPNTMKSRNRNYQKYMVKKTFYYHPEINVYVKIDINFNLKTKHITCSHGWTSPNTIRNNRRKNKLCSL